MRAASPGVEERALLEDVTKKSSEDRDENTAL
jgi:hypothetical protein